MIIRGTKLVTLGKSWKNMPREVVKGYYFVKGDLRHWIGETTQEAYLGLEKIADKYLNDKDGYNYWIDYCYGFDVKGCYAWMNLDNTDTILL